MATSAIGADSNGSVSSKKTVSTFTSGGGAGNLAQ